MANGFYCTLKRGQRAAFLLGPFPTKAEAEQHASAAHGKAAEVDPWAWFDPYGVCRVELPEGRELVPGQLNQFFPTLFA